MYKKFYLADEQYLIEYKFVEKEEIFWGIENKEFYFKGLSEYIPDFSKIPENLIVNALRVGRIEQPDGSVKVTIDKNGIVEELKIKQYKFVNIETAKDFDHRFKHVSL